MEIVDKPDRRRYELTVDGEPAGFVQYSLGGDVITLIHTEVKPEFGGRGFGRRLAKWALDDARVRALRVRPACPLIAAYIRGHPDYQDLVAERAARRR